MSVALQASAPRRRRSLKERAYAQYRKALRAGKLVRPARCSRCNTKCRPHGHHRDYARPLLVDWLCRRCHLAAHRAAPQPVRLDGRLPVGAQDLLAYLAVCEDAREAPNLKSMGRAIAELRKRRMIRRDRVATNAKGRKALAQLGGRP